ncbi:MAG TPA: amidoligase family protein, partial [Armatimonadota bacterium]
PISEEFIRRIERAKPQTKDDLNPLWFGQRIPHPEHYHPSRYCLLNYASVWFRNTLEIRAYQSCLHAGKIRAYILFSLALAAKALSTRSACSRKRKFDPQSAKYDMRVFLISGLKMNGEEFKTARKHLLARMPGDAAFKYGRPQRRKHEAGTDDQATEQNQNEVAEVGAGDITRPH